MHTSNNKIPIWKKIILILESILIVVYTTLTVFFVWYQVDRNGFIAKCSKNPLVRLYLNYTTKDDYEKNVQDTDFDKDKVIQNEGLSDSMETYRNIALFGIDSRGSEFDDSTHSDSIIIVSINNKNGNIRMASIYRDTMFKITDSNGNVSYTKANAGFFKGGPECAVNMLNTNLDLNITDYAVVNFTGLTKIIDALGGIDVNLSDSELTLVNGYLTETRLITGLDAPDVTHAGQVHLSGLQATAYCRIRYVTFTDDDGQEYNNDMGRTARQRSVIKKIVDKAKTAGASQVMDVANSILHYNTADDKILTTSLSFNQVMDLIPVMIKFTLTENAGFPFTCDTPTINKASMVVAQGLSYNVSKLHQFLFDEENYVPSSQVQTISDYLENYTGIPTVKLEEDRDTENFSSTSKSSSKTPVETKSSTDTE